MAEHQILGEKDLKATGGESVTKRSYVPEKSVLTAFLEGIKRNNLFGSGRREEMEAEQSEETVAQKKPRKQG